MKIVGVLIAGITILTILAFALSGLAYSANMAAAKDALIEQGYQDVGISSSTTFLVFTCGCKVWETVKFYTISTAPNGKTTAGPIVCKGPFTDFTVRE